MNQPVLRKPVAQGFSIPIGAQGSIFEMPIGELIVGGRLMLVRQLMVTRGMDGMLRMVCKMLRMSRRRVVRMQVTSGIGGRVVVRSSAETASAKAVAGMPSPEAVPSAKPVTAARTRMSDARTCYRYEDRRACRDNVFRPLHGSVPFLISQLRGEALR